MLHCRALLNTNIEHEYAGALGLLSLFFDGGADEFGGGDKFVTGGESLAPGAAVRLAACNAAVMLSCQGSREATLMQTRCLPASEPAPCCIELHSAALQHVPLQITRWPCLANCSSFAPLPCTGYQRLVESLVQGPGGKLDVRLGHQVRPGVQGAGRLCVCPSPLLVATQQPMPAVVCCTPVWAWLGVAQPPIMAALPSPTRTRCSP